MKRGFAGLRRKSGPRRSSSNSSFGIRCTPNSICCSGPDPINPTVGYLGSSNLTFAGLSSQGELNVDVLDHDACQKLANWFEDRWNDRWCLDISAELERDHRRKLGAEETDPAVPHLPQDGVSPVARGAGRADGVPHSAATLATNCLSSRLPPSRSPPTT